MAEPVEAYIRIEPYGGGAHVEMFCLLLRVPQVERMFPNINGELYVRDIAGNAFYPEIRIQIPRMAINRAQYNQLHDWQRAAQELVIFDLANDQPVAIWRGYIDQVPEDAFSHGKMGSGIFEILFKPDHWTDGPVTGTFP